MRKYKIRAKLAAIVCCVMLSSPFTAYAGYMITDGNAKAYVCDYDDDEPTDEEKEAIIAAAIGLQKDPYQKDVFWVEKLEQNKVLYAMIPGQGNFYTLEGEVRAANSAEHLRGMLQVRPQQLDDNPRFHDRTGVAAYRVKMPMYVARGECQNNPEYGPGGAAQYVIPITLQQTKLYEDEALLVSLWDQRTQ